MEERERERENIRDAYSERRGNTADEKNRRRTREVCTATPIRTDSRTAFIVTDLQQLEGLKFWLTVPPIEGSVDTRATLRLFLTFQVEVGEDAVSRIYYYYYYVPQFFSRFVYIHVFSYSV